MDLSHSEKTGAKKSKKKKNKKKKKKDKDRGGFVCFTT